MGDEVRLRPWRSPQWFTLQFERRDDGGLRITSTDVPELVLSGSDPHEVMRDLPTAIDMLMMHNSK
jgi:hypothetical protein